jgi:hypothetical protein
LTIRRQLWRGRLATLVEEHLSRVDIGQGRQARLVAEVLERMCRRRAGKVEVILPCAGRIGEVGVNVGAMKNVAGAIGVNDLLVRDIERRHRLIAAAPEIIDKPLLPERHAPTRQPRDRT